MQSRPRTFLTFSLFCLLPLLLISILSFAGNLKFNERLLRQSLNEELDKKVGNFESSLRDRQNELKNLASVSVTRNYLAGDELLVTETVSQTVSSSPSAIISNEERPPEVEGAFTRLLHHPRFYAAIAAYSRDKRLLFVAESPSQDEGGPVVWKKTLLPGQMQPDEKVWTTSEKHPLCTLVNQATLGKTLRCTTPVFSREDQAGARGALVADLKFDSLISPFSKRYEGLSRPANPAQGSFVVVLDDSGEIVYDSSGVHKHQNVNASMPQFVPVANAMMAGERGSKFYDGDQWLAVYTPLASNRLSLAVARNYAGMTTATRRLGWLGILFALLLGTAVTFFVTNQYLKGSKSLDRVKEGVNEIAKGKLDHRFDLRSSDDLRPLADNVALMTEQLREQIAREAETKQFQSFVRLSAILTHDIKNAIESLSLTVTNMERHFEKPEFRADAMQTLRSATENLRALVTRLSQPVTTLSGEFKRPKPVDLVPMLRRVIARTAATRQGQETKVNLPESVFALVDEERIEKVVENLVINAMEAMAAKGGTLTVEAGTTHGKAFFSVSDTGEGMNRRFVEERLFHPFVTTKSRGVGLGLYTCREVVRANAGTIEVDSRPGAGTTFRVVLPSAAINTSGVIQPQDRPQS